MKSHLRAVSRLFGDAAQIVCMWNTCECSQKDEKRWSREESNVCWKAVHLVTELEQKEIYVLRIRTVRLLGVTMFETQSLSLSTGLVSTSFTLFTRYSAQIFATCAPFSPLFQKELLVSRLSPAFVPIVTCCHIVILVAHPSRFRLFFHFLPASHFNRKPVTLLF